MSMKHFIQAVEVLKPVAPPKPIPRKSKPELGLSDQERNLDAEKRVEKPGEIFNINFPTFQSPRGQKWRPWDDGMLRTIILKYKK